MTQLRDLRDIPTDPADDTWQPINLNTLPDTPPIRPDLADTGLIYPGKRHVFSGPPESAKTLAAYCILIQIARTGHTAVLIDFEMGAYDARQRLRELGATPAEITRVLYLEPDTRATPTRIGALVEREPVLVVIDAAAGAFSLEGLDDNRRNEVETFTNLYIALFWRAGIATILIDHVVKDTDNRGRFAIGSERKLGGADVHIGFDTIHPISRGTAGRYKLIVHKDRGGYHKRGHLADLHLDSDPDTHQIDWRFTDPELVADDEGRKRRTGYMEKVSLELEDRSFPSRNAVVTAMRARKEFVLDALHYLIVEGFVTENLDDDTLPRLVSRRPYRELDPTCNPQNNGSGSAVPVWFRSGSRNQASEVVPRFPLLTEGTDRTPPPPTTGTNHPVPEPEGWFEEDGTLRDTYLDSIAPDPEPDPTHNDDIDWTQR